MPSSYQHAAQRLRRTIAAVLSGAVILTLGIVAAAAPATALDMRLVVRIVTAPTGTVATESTFITFAYAPTPDPNLNDDIQCRTLDTVRGTVVLDWAYCGHMDGIGSVQPSVTRDGTYTEEIQWGRLSGNPGPVARATWTVDTKLLTTITSGPAGEVSDPNATFSFVSQTRSGQGAGFEFRCRLDGYGEWIFCGSGQRGEGTYSWGPLGSGPHTFEVQGYTNLQLGLGSDAYGPIASRSWTISPSSADPASLDVEVTAPSGTIASRSTAIGMFAPGADPQAPYECRFDTSGLDAADWSPCVPGWTYPGLTDGLHTLGVRAVSPAGVKGPEVVRTFTTQAPLGISITAVPSGGVPLVTTTSFLAAIDYISPLESHIHCTTGDPVADAFIDCTSSNVAFIYPGVGVGSRSLSLWVTDDYGNVGPTSVVSFTIGAGDSSPPDTYLSTGPAATVDNGSAVLTFGSTEFGSTFVCTLDAGLASEITYTSGPECDSETGSSTLSNLALGAHTFAVSAIDVQGNVDPTPATWPTWTVTDAPTPPVVTITVGPGEGSTSSDAAATFEFSSPDADVTFQCRVRPGSFALCTSPWTTPGVLGSGLHTVDVRGTNAGGASTLVTRTWNVDTLVTDVPDTFILTGPPSTGTDPLARFDFHSTQPTSSFLCSVDGRAFADCADPWTVSVGVGLHHLAVSAKAGGLLDATPADWFWTTTSVPYTPPPTTTIDSGPGLVAGDATSTWFFHADQSGSSFTCTVDDIASPCASPYEVGPLDLGQHAFSVRATGPAGGTGAAATRTWTIAAVPDTVITSGPEGPWASADATFAFSVAGAGSGPIGPGQPAGPPQPGSSASATSPAAFQCSVDQGDWLECSSPLNIEGLPDGLHHLAVRAIRSGLTDQSPATREWTVDTVAPSVLITNGPIGTTTATDAQFDLIPSEAVAGYFCQLDTLLLEPCTSPVSYGGLGTGFHLLTVVARDLAGNDSAQATASWTVAPADGTAPVVAFDVTNPTLTSDSSPTVSIGTDDPGSPLECAVDLGAFAPCTSPWTTPALDDGPHTLHARSIDASGNASQVADWSLVVDTSVPVVAFLGGPDLTVTNDPTPELDLTVDPASATVECSADDGPYAACTSTLWSGPPMTDGPHELHARATNAAGTTSTVATATITVDTVRPVVVFDPTTPTRTGSTTPAIHVTSNEVLAAPVCAVDESELLPCGETWSPTLTPGHHVLYAGAMDWAGNTAEVVAWTIEVDTTAPVVTAVATPDASVPWTVRAGSFTFTADEPVTSYECSKDGGLTWIGCASPYAVTELADGRHDLWVRATDLVGNVSDESSYAKQSWHVAVPPALAVSVHATSLGGLPLQGAAAVGIGDDFVYRIVLTNTGTTPISGATATTTVSSDHNITVALPSGCTAPPRAAGIRNGLVTCTFTSLAAGATATRAIQVEARFGCTVWGDSGANTLSGTAAADVVCGGAGTDTVNANGGDDLVLGYGPTGSLSMMVTAAPGGATATSEVVVVDASARDGNDTLNGAAGNDTLRGELGDDTLTGGAGNDVLAGEDGNDTVTGNLGDDIIDGGPGDDTLDGVAGNDTLRGGDGSDAITGGGGADTVSGDAGDDTITGDAGNDVIDAGPGFDIARGGTENDTIDGGDDPDYLAGEAGADVITGGYGRDYVTGGAGNDTLDGGLAHDPAAVSPADHYDRLYGDAGATDICRPGPVGGDVTDFRDITCEFSAAGVRSPGTTIPVAFPPRLDRGP